MEKAEGMPKQPSKSLVGMKVEVWLTNGGRLQGVLRKAGERELVLRGESGEIVVFRHAVAYIIPLKGARREIS